MALSGLDIEAIRAVARQLADGAANLDYLGVSLQNQLQATPWDGPDAANFREQWEVRHKVSLTGAAGQLRDAGQQLLKEADEQSVATGADALQTPAAPPQPAQQPQRTSDEPEKKRGFLNKLGHGVLDAAGMVPLVGEPADGVNAIWYASEGDATNAALSAAGMIPILGSAATGAKVGMKGAKAADEAVESAQAADEMVEGAQAVAGNAQARSAVPEAVERGPVGSPMSRGYQPGGAASEFDLDELAQFAYGHSGAGMYTDRPGVEAIRETLEHGDATKLKDQNAFKVEYKNVRVIINEDNPPRSTAYRKR